MLTRDKSTISDRERFQKFLDGNTLPLNLSQPDGTAHQPAEKFSLPAFREVMAMSARLWEELGQAGWRNFLY